MPGKLSYKEQKELEDSEKSMEETEAKIQQLTNDLSSVDASDYKQIQEISEKIQDLKNQLDELTMRWLELSE